MAQAPAKPSPNPIRAWSVVGIMGALYIMSMVDRSVLALVVQPLKAALKLSDVQIGFLYGSSFAIFFALLGVPMGRLADRANRRLVIIVGAVIWALCTLGTGFTASFLMLNLLRVGLATGESVLVPSAHSMIGDLFPPHRRAFAAGLFTTTGFLGIGGGTIAVGFLVHALNQAVADHRLESSFAVWQLVFICVGLPTLILVGLFALIVREPQRLATAGEPGPTNRELIAYLAKNRRLYLGLFLGASATQSIVGAFQAWGPEFLRRTYGWDVRTAGSVLGLTSLITMTSSTLIAPWINRTIQKQGRRDSVALVAIGGAGLGGTLAAIGFVQPNPLAFVALYGAGSFLIFGGSMNVVFQLQELAPARFRGTLVALLLAGLNLASLGLGPPLAAVISNQISPSGDRLSLGLAIEVATTCAVGVALLVWARKGLREAMMILDGPKARD